MIPYLASFSNPPPVYDFLPPFFLSLSTFSLFLVSPRHNFYHFPFSLATLKSTRATHSYMLRWLPKENNRLLQVLYTFLCPNICTVSFFRRMSDFSCTLLFIVNSPQSYMYLALRTSNQFNIVTDVFTIHPLS